MSRRYQVILRDQAGPGARTICHFARKRTHDADGRPTGYSDWIVMHKLVRVRTVEPEAPDMREYFTDPIEAARAKRSAMVVVRTDTHFEFWNVVPQRISFRVTHDKLADVLDRLHAADRGSIDVATLRAALQRRSC